MSDLHDAVSAAVYGSEGDAGESGSDAGLGTEQTSEGFEGTSEAVTEVPEKQYLDLSEFEDRYVRVGDDEISVKDLPSGYMKAKDYTQKTQELAQQRQLNTWAQTVIAAMRENPEETVKYLRAEFAPEALPDVQETDDPLARTVAEIQHELAVQKQASVRSQIEREVAELTTQYGEDFDVHEAIALAGELGIRLPHAQEILYGRKARTSGSKAADLAAKVEAKRRDSAVSAGAGSRAVEPTLVQHEDLETALRDAMRRGGYEV